MCILLSVTATDRCTNQAVVSHTGRVFNCVGVNGKSAEKPLPGPDSPPSLAASWLSQLEIPGALGQAVLNRQTLVLATSGLSRHTARGHSGENRIDAQLVKGGKPGVWRFDLADMEGFEPGSLRVLDGEVVLLTDRVVVFRLRGEVGERAALSFRVK